MKIKSLVAASVMAISALVSASPALAGPIWEFTSAGHSYNNNNWNFANSFTVKSAVTVTGLGYYADPTNGQVDSNPVALYLCADAACSTTGTLIASATVTNTYALNGHFRYVTVTPVALMAGSTYEVAGVSHGDNYTWNDVGFHTDPAITYNDNRWVLGGTTPDFINFTRNDQTDGYWGPNVFIGAPVFTGGVPEPTTWAMMMIGFGVIGAAIRRRARRTTVRFA